MRSARLVAAAAQGASGRDFVASLKACSLGQATLRGLVALQEPHLYGTYCPIRSYVFHCAVFHAEQHAMQRKAGILMWGERLTLGN